MQVYAPVWFHIKKFPNCSNGARHLWKLIKWSRFLPHKYKAVIDPVIQRNAFFAHPENVLIGMIADHRAHIRTLGWRRILKARRDLTGEDLRAFKIPNLNMESEDYIDLIDWSQSNVTEPPLTMHLSEATIENYIQYSTKPTEEFFKFPCHTQAVERAVKLVTEASSSVCGAHNRHTFILATIKSRQEMPYFNIKSDFKID